MKSLWRWAASNWRRHGMWRIYRRAMSGELNYHQGYLDALESNGVADGAKSMFSIGPGDGRFEASWLSGGGERLGYVESFKPHARNLERRIASLGLSDRIRERHEGAFQDIEVKERYDLVVSIHSWFGFAEDESLLRKALSACKKGGHLVIALTREDDFLAGQVMERRSISAEALSRWATDLNYYHDMIFFDREIPRQALVRNGDLTPQAVDAIAFCFGQQWRNIPRARRCEIRDEVLTRTALKPAVRRHACLIFEHQS